MKIYIHQGAGVYLTSVGIVLAENEDEASVIMREALNKNGLKEEPVNLICTMELDKSGLVLLINGDY